MGKSTHSLSRSSFREHKYERPKETSTNFPSLRQVFTIPSLQAKENQLYIAVGGNNQLYTAVGGNNKKKIVLGGAGVAGVERVAVVAAATLAPPPPPRMPSRAL